MSLERYSLDSFPIEILIKIIEFLDFKAILKILNTQKRLLLVTKEYMKMDRVDEDLDEFELRKICCNFGDQIIKID